MKVIRIIFTAVVIGLLSLGTISCAGSSKSESTGEYVDDSVISNKVRAQLLDDKDLNVFKIDVTTYKGVVQLSGFVDSQSKKDKATQVASGVGGVKQVRNDLVVK